MSFGDKAEQLGLEDNEFIELVEIFLEATTSDLDRLDAAITAETAEQVLAAAHSIKGAAGSLGFEDAQGLAKDIEMNARQNILGGSLESSVALREEVKTIAETLKMS